MAERPTIIAANWKMHKTIEQSVGFIRELAPLAEDAAVQVWIAVPFTAIRPVKEASAGTPLHVGAQNMHDASEGAFTGEVAGEMLIEAGADFVILGHSERRQIFGETSGFINSKVKKALADGLRVILCVGETLEEREAEKAKETVELQIKESLKGVKEGSASPIVLAYEPVWAIGTGQTASADQAEEMHRHCRDLLGEVWSNERARSTPILYGGSVKPDNIQELIAKPDIDGALVGGASLSVESFTAIVNHQSKKAETTT